MANVRATVLNIFSKQIIFNNTDLMLKTKIEVHMKHLQSIGEMTLLMEFYTSFAHVLWL